jgi:hypothetical protein
MTLVSDIHYFAPVSYYFDLSSFSHCIFDQYEYMQKMSFRSRCNLVGGNGVVTLNIPLVGGRNQKTAMKDVRVLNKDKWQARHWKTICSCYNKSPFLDLYRYELEQLYARRFEFLIDWNMECFRWASDKMSISIPWTLTEKYIDKYDENGFVDIRNELKPSTIDSLYPAPPRYTQVFEDRFGFVPNLSVLDYLFCAGAGRGGRRRLES